MNDLDEYDKKSEEIRKENERYLELFKQDMEERRLSENTIRRHLQNAELYINDYLLYEDAYPMEDGLDKADMFFGDWYIRKCVATPGNMKSTAASIKKFYKSMLEHGFIEEKEYRFLNSNIKERMNDWIEECIRYYDFDEEDPFDIW